MHGLYITRTSGVETREAARVTRVCTQREISTKFLKAALRRNSPAGCQLLPIQINRTYLTVQVVLICANVGPLKWELREIDLSSDRRARSGLNFANKTYPSQGKFDIATCRLQSILTPIHNGFRLSPVIELAEMARSTVICFLFLILYREWNNERKKISHPSSLHFNALDSR